MLVGLPVLGLILLYLIELLNSKNWRKAWIDSSLNFGTIVVFLTEVLSLFKALNFLGVSLVWLGINAILATQFYKIINKNRKKIRFHRPREWTFSYNLLFIFTLFIIFTVGLIALIAPSNNWDTLAYHLPRVSHWIQNRSVEHYPSSNLSQLFMAPGSGFASMQFQILSGSDQFVNLIQWFSLVGCVIGVSLIAEELGANFKGQFFASIFCTTIPVGILHASNAKDTYAVAFWLVCFVYYVLLTKQSTLEKYPNEQLGMSLGLAILTKSTAYIYALPFFIILIFLNIKDKKYYFNFNFIKHYLIIFSIVILINYGYYIRNIDLFGSPLSNSADDLKNQIYGLNIWVSNLIKNLSLHLAFPFDFINYNVLENWVNKIHLILGIDINDQRTSSTDFSIKNLIPTYEDHAGNPFHLFLILLAFFAFVTHKILRNNKKIIAYILAVLAGFFMFCFYLKFAIWHSRLHLPLFVLAAPFVGLVFEKSFNSKVSIITMLVLVQFSLYYVFFNEFRPIIAEKNIFNQSRTEQYLKPVKTTAENYINATNQIKEMSCNKVGLELASTDLEHIWWVLFSEKISDYTLETINVDNISQVKSTIESYRSFLPCAIISLVQPSSSAIQYKDKTYQHIWQSPQTNTPIIRVYSLVK